jgi:transcriptional regulator with XRE-family HTH domain
MPSPLHTSRYQIFRDLLIDARNQIGMTQVQLAEKLRKPQSFVSKFERGERRLDLTEFIEIADVLEIDVNKFLKTYRTLTTATHRH